MFHALQSIFIKLESGVQVRREARLQALIAEVVADCCDCERQAMRLARWERRLNLAQDDINSTSRDGGKPRTGSRVAS